MMRGYSLILALVLFYGDLGSGSVLDLSSYAVDEFRSEMDNFDSVFVKFYAPYCGHCKTMANDYKAVARKMMEEEPPVTLAEVDCTSGTGTKICKKFNVQGYPSLQLFKHGKPYKTYEGTRDAKAMEEWLNQFAKTKSKRFSSYSELNDAIKRSKEPTVVAIFGDKDDIMVDMYLKAAKQVKDHWTYREVEFAHIFDEQASGRTGQLKAIGLEEGKALKAPAIVLHKPKWLQNKLEPSDIMYNMEEKQDITEWVFRKAFGVVLYRTRDSEESIKPPLIVAYYDFDFRTNPKWAHLWRNRLVKASQRHPDVKFAISNSQSFRKQLRRQSLEPPKGDDKPIFVGYDNFGTLYLMRDEYTKDAFEQFIVEYKNGDVSPHLRSQEPPVNADKMAVKVAVGGNFHKLVTTNKKDVFIVLYAPWCKHSQELEPVWEELGRQLEAERELDIVKMDAVANEVPSQFEVPQYPTIYFVPKDTKKALRYTGGRYIHEFVQFLAKHATNELALFERDGTLRKAKKSEL